VRHSYDSHADYQGHVLKAGHLNYRKNVFFGLVYIFLRRSKYSFKCKVYELSRAQLVLTLGIDITYSKLIKKI